MLRNKGFERLANDDNSSLLGSVSCEKMNCEYGTWIFHLRHQFWQIDCFNYVPGGGEEATSDSGSSLDDDDDEEVSIQ